MEQELINEKISEGHIHARVIFEMAGQPKEHVETTLKDFITKLKESKPFTVLSEEYAECVQNDDLWSTFVTAEILVKGVSNYVGMCFDFMPSSTEILAPEKMMFKRETMSDMLNDLQGKLHGLDMVTKQTVAENNFLKRNFMSIVRNLLAIILYKKELTLEETSSVSGIPKHELEPILSSLIEDHKIKKVENRFTLNLEVNGEREATS